MSVSHSKAAIRKERIAQRLEARDALRQSLSAIIAAKIEPYLSGNGFKAIYYPVRGEADVWTFIEYPDVCLPAIAPPSKELIFRKTALYEPLERNRLGIPQPPETAPVVSPDIILVPVVAFDRRGFRIGYGGGYYDATLEALRKEKKITAIGVAFAFQEIAEVPAEPFDHALDVIITEKEMLKFA